MSYNYPYGDYDGPQGRRLGYRPTLGGAFKARLIIAALVVGMALVSYVSKFQRNPVTGELQAVSLSAEQEMRLGNQSAPELIQQMGGAEADVERDAMFVDQVGARLVSSAEVTGSPYAKNFTFHLLRDPQTVNAFALPGGQIFITRALYDRFENEAQLAGVLGHEIGHVIHRHSAQQMAKQELAGGLIQGVGAATADQGQIGQVIASYVGQFTLLKYSRDHEIESDSYGLRLMVEQGYDPAEMIKVMEILKNASGDGPRGPQMMQTHPYPEDRIAKIKQWLEANREQLRGKELGTGRAMK
jgi:predicted Zn-dependent protease